MVSSNEVVTTSAIKLLVTGSLCLLLSGCVKYDYTARPVETDRYADSFHERQLDDPALREFMLEYGYDVQIWPVTSWNLHNLTLAAYYFNPKINVAIAQYNKSLVNEDVATLYPNPGIQIPLEYHSDTSDFSGDISPWLIGIVFDFVFERSSKREARLEQARAGIEVSRIRILGSAWQIYQSVRDAWLDHYIALSTRQFLQKKLDVVGEIVTILSRSFELGQTSEFELNTRRLELQRVRLELVNQDVKITDSLHKLAAAIGVPVTVLGDLDIDYSRINQYLDSQQFSDTELQELALTHRLDMQEALSEYIAYEAALKLEIEKQYPDINLSPGFIFDQNDNIWALGASWVVPLFHSQNEGPVKLALADRKIKQAEVISLQTNIINNINRAYSRIESTSIALKEAGLLMQEAMERSRQLQTQIELGQIDNLVVLRNELELLSIEGARRNIELDVIRAAFDYENAVQYPLLDVPAYKFNNDVKAGDDSATHENP